MICMHVILGLNVHNNLDLSFNQNINPKKKKKKMKFCRICPYVDMNRFELSCVIVVFEV